MISDDIIDQLLAEGDDLDMEAEKANDNLDFLYLLVRAITLSARVATFALSHQKDNS